MAQEKDILLDENDDLDIKDGDFVVGNSFRQEVYRLLSLSAGELKSDPILGPGLTRFTLANVNQNKLKSVVRKHLGRDGKSWEQVKNIIELNNKTQ